MLKIFYWFMLLPIFESPQKKNNKKIILKKNPKNNSNEKRMTALRKLLEID
jgi:hypothetical protein